MAGFTSIHQANQLLDAGLPKFSADLCYQKVKYEGKSEPTYVISMSTPKGDDIPSWSVNALLESLPPGCGLCRGGEGFDIDDPDLWVAYCESDEIDYIQFSDHNKINALIKLVEYIYKNDLY